jgi:hypothetical protein
MPRIYTRIPIEDRFWKFVVKGPDCWKWTGATANKGYGVVNSGGKGTPVRAHRLSWEIHNRKPIPKGVFVCHRCDNPKSIIANQSQRASLFATDATIPLALILPICFWAQTLKI